MTYNIDYNTLYKYTKNKIKLFNIDNNFCTLEKRKT